MSFLGLKIASNTMLNSQKTLEIIGQNIANSQVEGYTRQEAIQTMETYGYTTDPPSTGTKAVVTRINEIARYRVSHVDNNIRREKMIGGEIGKSTDYLQELSDIFTDDSDFGLPNVLNEFWQSWNRAGQSPEDMALRDMVLQNGEVLCHSINMKAHKMDELIVRVDNEIKLAVDSINNTLKKLASINDQIIPSAPKSYQVNIMLDERDRLMDQLADVVDFKVAGDVNDTLSVYLDGAPLVQEKNAYEISFTKDAGGDYHFTAANGRELQIRSGELRGLLDIYETTVPAYRQEMDEVAEGLIEQVNNIHQHGYGSDGTTGLDFFNGTGAADIQMNASQPEQVALGVASLSSTAQMNLDGEKLSPELTIASQLAKFATAPDDNAGAGEFTVNGNSVTWDNNDTIKDILDKIESASGLTAQFDTSSQTIMLAAPPDDSTITVADVTGNFTAFANLDTAVTQAGASGDGRNGIKIFELINKQVFGTPPTTTINDKYKNFVEEVGFDTNGMKSVKATQDQYLETLFEMQASAGGVSVDEELVDLLRFQRSYQAGARLATIMDETIQSVLEMGR